MQIRTTVRNLVAGWMICGLMLAITAPASAQNKKELFPLLPIDAQKAQGKTLVPEAPVTLAVQDPQIVAALVSAEGKQVEEVKPGDVVVLNVTALIPQGSYTYNISGPGAFRTVINLNKVRGLDNLDADFRPDRKPKKEYDDLAEGELEKFTSQVTWSRKFRVREGVDPAGVKIEGEVDWSVCDDSSCNGQTSPIAVGLTNPEDAIPVAAVPMERFPLGMQHRAEIGFGEQKQPGPAEVLFSLGPAGAEPGQTVTLTITIKLDEKWHTYALNQPRGAAAIPTSIEITNLTGLKDKSEQFQPSQPPEESTEGGKRYLKHKNEISWTRQFEVTGEEFGMRGSLTYQTCSGQRCLEPQNLPFALGAVAMTTGAQSGTFDGDEAPPINEWEFTTATEDTQQSLWVILLSAFLGGIILNVMPCVLPVIAIKAMSFVQQAGEDRKRILALNFSYTLGVLTVFMILASLAVGVGMSWGGLFQNVEFNIAMICLVFVMGLSLFGIFELPIPGFAGSGFGQRREGLPGAFLTGMFATILSTPCSGPLLGPVFGFSLTQSPAVIYLLWTMIGLGLAFPYLLLGLFPSLIEKLPHPGNWMIRVKQIGGFFMMGTGIFLLNSVPDRLLIPVLVVLLGLGLGLWMVGTMYDYSTPVSRKRLIRSFALLVVAGTSWMGLALGSESEGDLNWEPFSEKRLEESLREGKTVLIDFTADWCLSCKYNERTALNTTETKRLVQKHDVVTLKADYTDKSNEIKGWLNRFQSNSVPLTVIFPGNNPKEPILLRDVFTQTTLISSLEEAVQQDPGTASQITLNK